MATEQRVVVVAMDRSECANYAFEYYVKTLHRPGDQVVIVHVPQYPSVMQLPIAMVDVSVVASLMQEEEIRMREFSEDLQQRMKNYGINGEVEIESGEPGDVICKVAKKRKATLIVLGSRGSGKLRRTLMGSVSSYVMHHAHTGVLVTNRGAHHLEL